MTCRKQKAGIQKVFKSGNASAADAEYMEEPIPERFCLRIFAAFIFPFLAKGGCTGFYFIPTEGH